ncbi:hypothetical protein C3R30_21605, partial [Mycobacterium tuberculosis]
AALFAAFGLLPVGSSALRPAASPLPVVSPAFRPLAAPALAPPPFRVFPSLLALEARRSFAAALRPRVPSSAPSPVAFFSSPAPPPAALLSLVGPPR